MPLSPLFVLPFPPPSSLDFRLFLPLSLLLFAYHCSHVCHVCACHGWFTCCWLPFLSLSFAWATPLSDLPLPFPFVPFPFVPFPLTWGFKTYLRHQKINNQGIEQILKGSKKYRFFLRWCIVLALLCHFQILWLLNLPVLQSSPLVSWSLGPLVPWSFGPLVLRSLGPLVFWSLGPSVLLWLWCFKVKAF